MTKLKQYALHTKYIVFQLAIAFGLLITIVIGVGWLGLSQLRHVERGLQAVVDKRWAKVETSRKALTLSAENNRITMEVFLLDDSAEIERLLARRAENSEKIHLFINELGVRGIDSSKESELLEAVKTTRAPYVASYKHALELLLKEYHTAEATAAMVRHKLPLLIAHHQGSSGLVRFQRGRT